MGDKPPKSQTGEPHNPHILGIALGLLLSLFLLCSRDPQQDSVEGISPNENLHDKKDDSGKSLVPLPSQIPPSPADTENSCKCCHHRTAWWKILLEVATFVSVVTYAIVTYRMWREMQTQTVNSERAWVGLDVPITIDAVEIKSTQTRIKGHYTVKNFGHGPALKVMQFGNFVTPNATMEFQKREADFFCDSSVKFATGTVPMVGTKQPSPFGHTLFFGQWDDWPIEFQGLKETNAHLRFVGCVAYLDQFKEVHWTRFCMERRPGDTAPTPKLDFCAMYNETDQQK
jgi:hypothetical protein